MVKTLALSILLTAFATAGLLSNSVADGSSITFQVANQQPHPMAVKVTDIDSVDYYVAAPSENTYSVEISNTAASVTIAGQTVPYGTNTHVMLLDGTVVGVKWQSPSMVVIVDRDEIL